MKRSTEKWINKQLKKRWLTTLILTIIFFTIGVADYLVQETLKSGVPALIVGVPLVWFLLWFTHIDKVIFR